MLTLTTLQLLTLFHSPTTTQQSSKTINMVIASALTGSMDQSGKSSVIHPPKSKSPHSDFIQP
jgi:hypothetical protein